MRAAADHRRRAPRWTAPPPACRQRCRRRPRPLRIEARRCALLEPAAAARPRCRPPRSESGASARAVVQRETTCAECRASCRHRLSCVSRLPDREAAAVQGRAACRARIARPVAVGERRAVEGGQFDVVHRGHFARGRSSTSAAVTGDRPFRAIWCAFPANLNWRGLQPGDDSGRTGSTEAGGPAFVAPRTTPRSRSCPRMPTALSRRKLPSRLPTLISIPSSG